MIYELLLLRFGNNLSKNIKVRSIGLKI